MTKPQLSWKPGWLGPFLHEKSSPRQKGEQFSSFTAESLEESRALNEMLLDALEQDRRDRQKTRRVSVVCATICLVAMLLFAAVLGVVASGAGPVPGAMQAVWDWEHEKMVDTITRIRAILGVYKGAR